MSEITTSTFITSSNGTAFPDPLYPEMAFAGRSNCGKSTLINMLINRKNLVKTGSMPGMTKLANYFLINESLYLVDLPGYGYAKMPVREKKKLEALIYTYIDTRFQNIRVFFVLMDIRRIPAAEERNLLHLLAKKGVPAALTLTKADKVNRKERNRQIQSIQKELQIDSKQLFVTSSHTREGRDNLLDILNDYL